MKASELCDGYYYVQNGTINGAYGGHIHGQIIQKIGDQINYFGTDYFDRSDQLEGIFYPIDVQKVKKDGYK